MPSGEAAQEILYGREQQVPELLGAQAPVTAVSGDSGGGRPGFWGRCPPGSAGLPRHRLWSGTRRRPLQASLLEALGAAAALNADDEGAARRVGRPLVDDGRRSREEEHAVGGERAVPNMRLHLRAGGVRPRAARDPARLGLPGLWKWQ